MDNGVEYKAVTSPYHEVVFIIEYDKEEHDWRVYESISQKNFGRNYLKIAEEYAKNLTNGIPHALAVAERKVLCG